MASEMQSHITFAMGNGPVCTPHRSPLRSKPLGFKHAQSIATTASHWTHLSPGSSVGLTPTGSTNQPRRMLVSPTELPVSSTDGQPSNTSTVYITNHSAGHAASLLPPAASMIPTPLAARQIFMHPNAVSSRRRSPLAPAMAKRATYADSGEIFIDEGASDLIPSMRVASGGMSPLMVIERGVLAWNSPPNTPIYVPQSPAVDTLGPPLIGGITTATELGLLSSVRSPPTMGVDKLAEWTTRSSIERFLCDGDLQRSSRFPANLMSPYLLDNPGATIVGPQIEPVVYCPFRSLKLTLSNPDWKNIEKGSVIANEADDDLLVFELSHGNEMVKLVVNKEEVGSEKDELLCSVQMPLEMASVLRLSVKRLNGEWIGHTDIDIPRAILSKSQIIEGTIPIGSTLNLAAALSVQGFVELSLQNPFTEQEETKATEPVTTQSTKLSPKLLPTEEELEAENTTTTVMGVSVSNAVDSGEKAVVTQLATDSGNSDVSSGEAVAKAGNDVDENQVPENRAPENQVAEIAPEHKQSEAENISEEILSEGELEAADLYQFTGDLRGKNIPDDTTTRNSEDCDCARVSSYEKAGDIITTEDTSITNASDVAPTREFSGNLMLTAGHLVDATTGVVHPVASLILRDENNIHAQMSNVSGKMHLIPFDVLSGKLTLQLLDREGDQIGECDITIPETEFKIVSSFSTLKTKKQGLSSLMFNYSTEITRTRTTPRGHLRPVEEGTEDEEVSKDQPFIEESKQVDTDPQASDQPSTGFTRLIDEDDLDECLVENDDEVIGREEPPPFTLEDMQERDSFDEEDDKKHRAESSSIGEDFLRKMDSLRSEIAEQPSRRLFKKVKEEIVRQPSIRQMKTVMKELRSKTSLTEYDLATCLAETHTPAPLEKLEEAALADEEKNSNNAEEISQPPQSLPGRVRSNRYKDFYARQAWVRRERQRRGAEMPKQKKRPIGDTRATARNRRRYDSRGGPPQQKNGDGESPTSEGATNNRQALRRTVPAVSTSLTTLISTGSAVVSSSAKRRTIGAADQRRPGEPKTASNTSPTNSWTHPLRHKTSASANKTT